MAHNENAKLETAAQEQESLLLVRVVGIVILDGVLVKERCLRFLERNTVLALVRLILALVPRETQHLAIIMLV